ncbi:MAG: hypothetical protein J5379_02115 [Clostridiales bacterium]|nr:hypothetical protein [Clostridiales bacterium]
MGMFLYLNGGVVQNCYVTGSVTSSTVYPGGVVGNNEGIVRYCYSVAAVSGKYSGGVIGWNDGTVNSCYYDSEVITAANAIANNNGQVSNVSGLSTSQMTGPAAKENMTGFDFGNVWFVTASYPSLKNSSWRSSCLRMWMSSMTVLIMMPRHRTSRAKTSSDRGILAVLS